MAAWPRKVKWFKEWATGMVDNAETNEHGRVPTKARPALAGRSKRRFRGKRRKLKREEA